MKEIIDEKIQAMLESGLNVPEQSLSATEKSQLDSYRSLFQNLKAEPVQGLPFNFASKVSAQLKLKLKRRSDLKFNLLAALGIMIGLFVSYGALKLVDASAGEQFLLGMLRFKWLLIMGSAALLSTLVFDQKIVEKS